MSEALEQLGIERAAWARYVPERPWMATTVKAYNYMFGRLADWLETNDLCLADCGVAELTDFLDDQDWGSALRNKTSAVLRPFVRWHYGSTHPLAKWTVNRVPPPPQRYMTEEQLGILLSSFAPGISRGSGANNRYMVCDTGHRLGIRNLAILCLLIDSGLRASELCRLQIPRIDLEKGLATVRVKGGQFGFGFFSETTARVLRNWLDTRAEYASEESRDYLFIGLISQNTGGCFKAEGLRKMLRQLGKISGVGPLSPHDLRRSFAILTPKLGGADDYEMKRAGNWKDLKTYHDYRRHEQMTSIRHKLIMNFIGVSGL
jgi:integrase